MIRFSRLIGIAVALSCTPEVPTQEPKANGAEALYRAAVAQLVEPSDEVFDAMLEWERGAPITAAHGHYVRANANALSTFSKATLIRACRFDLTSKDGVTTELETLAPQIYELVNLATFDGLLRATDASDAAIARCRELFATATHLERHPRALALGVAGEAERAACDVAEAILAGNPDAAGRNELARVLDTRLAHRPSPDALLVADRLTTEQALEHVMRTSRGDRPVDEPWRRVTKLWRAELERRFGTLHEPLQRAIDRRDPDLLEGYADVIESMKEEHRTLRKELGPLDVLDPQQVPKDAVRALPMYFTLLMSSDLPTQIRQTWQREQRLRDLAKRLR